VLDLFFILLLLIILLFSLLEYKTYCPEEFGIKIPKTLLLILLLILFDELKL
jgi:hypothetical protein